MNIGFREYGTRLGPNDVDEATAAEMLLVGVVPSDTRDAIGSILRLGPRRARVVGHVDKQAFLDAVVGAGNSPARVALFATCPLEFYLRVEEA